MTDKLIAPQGDLVGRLRKAVPEFGPLSDRHLDCIEAADEIERLQQALLTTLKTQRLADDAMVERVARAICRSGPCRGFCHSDRCRTAVEQYETAARAALAEGLRFLLTR